MIYLSLTVHYFIICCFTYIKIQTCKVCSITAVLGTKILSFFTHSGSVVEQTELANDMRSQVRCILTGMRATSR